MDGRHGASDPGAAAAWLAGGGEMGERIRAWTGPPLRSAPPTLAAEPAQRGQHPAALQGADLPLLGPGPDQALQRRLPPGARRQASRARSVARPRGVERDLGRARARCWRASIATGEAFRASDHPFYLDRHGFTEETYFDVSYDPVRDETGKVGGVFCIVSETTGRVLERAPAAHAARSGPRQGGPDAGGGLRAGAAPRSPRIRKDIPFASLYLLDAAAPSRDAPGSVGVPAGGALSPARSRSTTRAWPLAAVARSGRPRVAGVALAAAPRAAARTRRRRPDAGPSRSCAAASARGFVVAGASRFARRSTTTTAASSIWSPRRSGRRWRRRPPTRRSGSAPRRWPSSTAPRPPSSATSATSSARR